MLPLALSVGSIIYRDMIRPIVFMAAKLAMLSFDVSWPRSFTALLREVALESDIAATVVRSLENKTFIRAPGR